MRPGQRLARLAVVLALALLVWAGPAVPIRLNFTSSLPRGIYLLDGKTEAQRGDLVMTCLPLPIVRAGFARGYLHIGGCVGGSSPVLKYAAAVAGDRVRVGSDGVVVNGRRLDLSARRVTDRAGRELEYRSFEERTLIQGELWLYAAHPDSWDSRYYGPVPASGVIARMRPLLTLPGRFGRDRRSHGAPTAPR